MKNRKIKILVTSAMLAAVYTALTLALSFISFGGVQFRIAEAMTLLPVLSPHAIAALSLGCALSNLIGFLMGANPLGVIDVFLGTAATLSAAVLTYWCRKIRFHGLPLLSAVFPVLMNGLVIGAELSWVTVGAFQWKVFLINALGVALPEAVICFGIGIWLVRLLEKRQISLY